MSGPILQIDNLEVRYPNTTVAALGPVNLTIRRGQLVLIHGRSGCGKSTLFKVLNGLIPQVEPATVTGSVLMDGRELGESSPQLISRTVGSVFQNFEAQIIQTTVGDELVFGMENLNVERQEMSRRLLGSAFVSSWPENTPVERLSGGTKQKLILEAVLAMQPEMLILDEPLSNLDADSSQSLLVQLRKLADQGKTVIMIEHRVDLVEQWADQVVNLGRYSPGVKNQVKKGAEPADAVLDVSDLRFSYVPGQPVLQGADLTLARGASTVLMGDNGSGKSTLFRVLAGLVPYQGGSVQLLGRELRAWKRKRLRNVLGYVLQNPNHQLFMKSVREEIMMGAASEDDVGWIVDTAGIGDLLDRHPFSLSEGQKRLVACCAVLAGRPQVLLLDEPTIGQDDQSLDSMLHLVQDMIRQGQTAVLSVTHDSRAAQALGSVIYQLEGGKTVLHSGMVLTGQTLTERPL